MNKGLIVGVIVVVLLLILGGWALMKWQSSLTTNEYSSNENTPENQTPSSGMGSLYLSVTDAAVDMKNVTEVTMTVDKAYVHSSSRGWVSVSDIPQTFSLLDLKAKGSSQLMAKADIPADTYDQVRLHISNITIKESGKIKTATLPSGDFTVANTVTVQDQKDSSLNIDVLADKSLYATAKGEIVFAPVIKMESRENATVTVRTDNSVEISGGTVDAQTTAGMDVNGDVKMNFTLPSNVKLNIDSTGIITI